MKTKILALVIIMILLFNSVSVFADEYVEENLEELSEDVKNAMAIAKSKVDIDEQCTDFSYEILYEDGHTIYRMIWSNNSNYTDYAEYKEYIAAVDSEGDLIRYTSPNMDNYRDYDNLLFNVKQEDAIINAENFIRKVIPERADELELFEVSNDVDSFTFEFAQKINGAFVTCDDTRISVSKIDGEILTFSSYGKYFQDKINRKSDDLIDKETAKQIFFENEKIKLSYISDFDYEAKCAYIYPAYCADSVSIDAHSGKIYDFFNSEPLDIISPIENNDNREFNISEFEGLEEIGETSGFISLDDAINVLKKYNIVKNDFAVPDSEEEDTFYDIIESEYNKDEYFWYFYGGDNNDKEDKYRYIFSINAKSGKIKNFARYNHTDEDKNENLLSKEEVRTKISEYLNLLCPELLNDLNYEYTSYNESYNQYSALFVRKVRDNEINSNYVIIKIDANTGELISFDKVWYNDINIIDKKINITPDEAFEIYNKYADFNLRYTYVMNEDTKEYDKIDAVYKGNNFYYFIDVENGKLFDSYSGKYSDYEEFNTHLDLSDSEYADEIIRLYDSGFYLNENKFNPAENMTKKDFIEFLYSGLEDRYYTQRNTKKGKEDILSIIDSPNDFMTKNDCAKILMYIMDCEKISDKDEIFDNIYDDVPLENRAEVGLTTSLSIIEADGDNFNGDKIISNEEGAHIIYNLISLYWENKFFY